MCQVQRLGLTNVSGGCADDDEQPLEALARHRAAAQQHQAREGCGGDTPAAAGCGSAHEDVALILSSFSTMVP